MYIAVQSYPNDGTNGIIDQRHLPNSFIISNVLLRSYITCLKIVIVAGIVRNTTDASQDAFSLLFPFSLVVVGIRCAFLFVLQLLEKLNLWWPACNIIILAVVMIGSKCVITDESSDVS